MAAAVMALVEAATATVEVATEKVVAAKVPEEEATGWVEAETAAEARGEAAREPVAEATVAEGVAAMEGSRERVAVATARGRARRSSSTFRRPRAASRRR